MAEAKLLAGDVTVSAPPVVAVKVNVAELLKRSRAAHQDHYRAAAIYREGNWLAGDMNDAKQSMQAALDLRNQADAADPTHADAEWKNDPVAHDELVRFFEQYLKTH